eukprot:TRINITY_DN30920_c0_g1_i1.p1 TRINITY_DN30920_c0_g1~~TRINITY_DN30920_c0_g1_i1.p1  ORF type:complete len:401 (+),score=32.10 TRINITY_DN30920_c0_g1_i1:131-1333(+)
MTWLKEIYYDPWRLTAKSKLNCCQFPGCSEDRKGDRRDRMSTMGSTPTMVRQWIQDVLSGINRDLHEMCGANHWVAPEPPDVPDFETIFWCAPLRMGVFMIALIHTIVSCHSILSHHFVYSSVRFFTGGYCLWSRGILLAMDTVALLFGPLGMVGAWTLRTSYVMLFKNFMTAHIPAWLLIGAFDGPLVWNCEDWKSNPRMANERYGFSAVIQSIAQQDGCNKERMLFAVGFLSSLVFFAYVTTRVGRFHSTLEEDAPHVLRVMKDQAGACGAFRGVNYGGRSTARAQAIAAAFNGIGPQQPFAPSLAPDMMGAPGMMAPGTMGPPGMMATGMIGPPGMMAPAMMGPPGTMAPGMMGPPMAPGMMGSPGMMAPAMMTPQGPLMQPSMYGTVPPVGMPPIV